MVHLLPASSRVLPVLVSLMGTLSLVTVEVSPPQRPSLDVYESFLDDVEEFKKLNSLPVDVRFGEQETAQNFLERMLHGINNAIRSSILRC